VIGAATPPGPRGGGVATAALLGVALGFLGLLADVPFYLGPAVAAVGVVASTVWRVRRPTPGGSWALVPALAALAALCASAPAAPPTELFGGISGLAFLLWVADDPGRATGGGQRAVPMLAPAALGVGLAWVIALALTGETANIGLTGSLLVVALVALAVLVSSLSARRPEVAPPSVDR
jgi:hypothetical protein